MGVDQGMRVARALVDRHVAWMAGPGRPSPQRSDEDDGAAAEFLVGGTLVVVFASHEGKVEIYGLSERNLTIFDFTAEGDEDLPPEHQVVVTTVLDEMGKSVAAPVEPSRTVWREQG